MAKAMRVAAREGSQLALRSYVQISEEIARRTGSVLSPTRVQQICARAEAKLAKALKATMGGRNG